MEACLSAPRAGLAAPRLPAPPDLLSSAEWVQYFRENAAQSPALPWHRGAEIADDERDAIGRSLQAWQLGETSDGSHLRTAAARYADQVGDPGYLAAIELFIREEQRHGAMLGRFLDKAGIGRVQADWGDTLFRAARYCIPNMEIWTTAVVMVETLALVYYNAIRRATGSALLRAICRRILADEIPHLRFQCERLAIIHQRRRRWAYGLTMLLHRMCFLVVMLLVWAGHRRALRAGGYGWRRYWRAAWDRMGGSWRAMHRQRTSSGATCAGTGGWEAANRGCQSSAH